MRYLVEIRVICDGRCWFLSSKHEVSASFLARQVDSVACPIVASRLQPRFDAKGSHSLVGLSIKYQ